VPRDRLALSIARWISILCHPLVLASLLLLSGTIKREGLTAGLESASTVLGFVVIPIALFMAWRFRSGAWSTIDASRPRERPALYGFALVLLLGLLLIVARRPEMRYLARTTFCLVGMLLVAFMLNRWIKASLHLSFCAFSGVVALNFAVPLGVLLLATLPLLSWARLRMGRHTLSEVIVGASLGLSAGAIAAFG